MRYDPSILRLNENLIEKSCEVCGKRFFINGRYSEVTKYCSNNCLQISYYRRRKNAEYNQMDEYVSSSDIPDNSDNIQKTNDMNEETRELLKLTTEVGELRGKLSAQSRDTLELNALKREMYDYKSLISTANTKSETFQRRYDDLIVAKNKIFNELESCQSELESCQFELEEVKQKFEELQEQYDNDIDYITDFQTDKQNLVLTCLIMQTAGVFDYNGKKVKFADIEKHLGDDFEYTVNQDFQITVEHWMLDHKSGSPDLIISKAKQ